MAAFQAALGHRAAFLVTPLAGALLIWVTFLLGRHVHSPAAGLAASWLIATSPAFLFNLMWPMTDIAAALCAGVMVWLLVRDGRAVALSAGVAASAGLLTRPNFVLLAAGAIAWLSVVGLATRDRTTAARLVAFVAGLVPGIALTAWFNLRWFGRVVASGYGGASELLSLDRVLTNAGHYFGWLMDSSPILVVGFLAMCLPVAWLWGRPAWRVPLLFTAITAATASVYLVYQTFNDWWYLRFLLPSWPLAAVGVGAALGLAQTRSRVLGALMLIVVLASGWQGVMLARQRGVFHFGEERYASVAALVAATTEPAAVILTMSHSGAVRYYAGRETIRFDVLDPAWLDRATDWLAARGRKPYVLVEDWEVPLFRERFGPFGELGALRFAPAATWESTKVAGRVYLYDPIDRDRFATADPGAALERDRPRSSPSRFPKLAFE
jgi:hypothetical protein